MAFNRAEVDPEALRLAVEAALSEAADFRTRLLIRDSIRALEAKWGESRMQAWLDSLPFQSQLEAVRQSTADVSDEDAFPSLKGRIVTPTKAEDVKVFLRELSLLTKKPTEIYIRGSIALILAGHLSRHTEDIDLVDEVPKALREDPAALDRLAQRSRTSPHAFSVALSADGMEEPRRIHRRVRIVASVRCKRVRRFPEQALQLARTRS